MYKIYNTSCVLHVVLREMILIYSEYNEFLDDLEEDPELRQNINIFRDSRKQIPVDTDEIDPSIPQITLEEMLDDLVIEDAEMAEVSE